MSELLMDDTLNKRLREVDDSAGADLRVLARARTITVLSQLEDGFLKGSVLQFLYEANLITWGSMSRNDEPAVLSRGPAIGSTGVVDLSGANLGRVELRIANLYRAALGSRQEAPGVYLWYANLKGADLRTSLLYKANLSHANLKGANLPYSDLTEVTAIGTNFSRADLIGTNLSKADLRQADLSHANLFGANFSKADLRQADLSHACLENAYKLVDLGLNEWNPKIVSKLATNEELDHQARSLEGATMPNGQKYEDWLKDKKGP
jgi:uncharacterized protein YjbI with pentapeptide repeats